VDNRHLNDLVESISVNVGGSYWNVKVSMSAEVRKSVGGVIVLRVWESHIHGEGHQEKGVPVYSVAASPMKFGRTGSTTSCEQERDDKAEGNPSSGMSISGEPGAGAPRGVWK
jgi:hypothetical protein